MPGFRFFNSNRLEKLLDQLTEVVSRPLDSPLRTEIIVVQSPGMQRWLSLRLAERFGVWANDGKSFPFPNAFIWDSFRALDPHLPQKSPFDREILHWRIMDLLPDLLSAREFTRLRHYCEGRPDPLRLYQLAGKLADLFDQYIVYRTDLLKGWEQGRGDEDEPWQAILWQKLCEKVETPHRGQILDDFLTRVATTDLPPGSLPQRLSIFGIPSLPPMHFAVFQALARHIEINLFLLNPSREYWGDIVSAREAARRKRQLSFSFDQRDLHLGEGNPLLASMGKLGRDFFRQLMGDIDFEHEFSAFDDPGEDTLLHCIQKDILFLRDRPGRRGRKKTLAADDDSLQVHSCHSAVREMEVLHDQLLNLFNRYPSLTPNDVVVMIPDLEDYAPYISAVFERSGENQPRIPFHIADRGIRRQSPVVEALLKILSLPESRFGAPQIMDILETPAVMERFELTTIDLDLVRRWISQTRIRWGIDAADRVRHGVPPFADNSWRAGLQRLLLGYAMPEEDRLFKDILPHPVVAGGNAHPLGSLLDFTEALFHFSRELERPRSPDAWSDLLYSVLERFFSSTGDAEMEVELVRGVLRRFRECSVQADFPHQLSLDVVRAHLRSHLEESGRSQGFLSGGVTFCALLPMRSIPFRVIVLAGMNDGTFPRIEKSASFDLMARRPRLGDRSRRDEDRYLFLEALVSARNHLIISYVGQNARDGSIAPPSVLVSELLDVVERGFTGARGDILDQVVQRHRLQAFHPDYFQKESPLFTFSSENCKARQALLDQERELLPLVASALPELPATAEVSLKDLVRFFQHPVRAFLEFRLGIRLSGGGETLTERESLSLDPLERFQVVNRLVADFLTGAPQDGLYLNYRARGYLPPGNPGLETFRECAAEAAAFVETLGPLKEKTPRIQEVDLYLEDTHLVGRIVHRGLRGPLLYRLGTLRGKDLLEAWLMHLVCLGCGERVETYLVGRQKLLYWEPLPEKEAKAVLNDLLSLYREGMRRPLPIYPKSSFAFAEQLAAGKTRDQAYAKAIREWQGNNHKAGEEVDPWICYALKGTEAFTGDFEPLTLRLYSPLLQSLRNGTS